jgi:5-(carboxyamino)imidazole ribonucleotide synthase
MHIGIVGGGQLGRMIILSGLPLGMRFTVLDPSENCPCAHLGAELVVAALDDAEAIERLGRAVDVLTYEIEHINVDALSALEQDGRRVRPSGETLAVVQDKYEQRRLLHEAGLPGPRFAAIDELDDEALRGFGMPAVQKLRRGGYDGRGVALLAGPESPRLRGASLLEERVAVEKELALVTARDASGVCSSFDVCELEFDPQNNICTRVIAPARVEADTAREAERLGEAAAAAVGCVGICATELFLTTEGRLLINELAPRPHNSGHWTIEGAETGQFEQHLRAVSGLPLGSPRRRGAAVMRNILAEPGSNGAAVVRGLTETLAIPGAHVHLYGKAEARSRRKMGHVTVTAEHLDEALRRAEGIALRIEGERDG